ncbi:MAG: formylmethanofuran dehydrogenase subunit C [Pseudomonadota bacterium]|nr:formylmethanofuran dehydrogenase subunit C [Pseudomonadota bacterium]
MKPLTLRLKKQLRFRLDGSFLTENNFKSVSEFKKLKILYGNKLYNVAQLFSISGQNIKHIIVKASNHKIDNIGYKMKDMTIVIHGNVGNSFGKEMLSGNLSVHGNTLDYAGSGLVNGTIQIFGNTGRYLGGKPVGKNEGIVDGVIYIHGNVGDHSIQRMRRGIVVINGNLGNYCCKDMISGSIVIKGEIGDHFCEGIKRGTIVTTQKKLASNYLTTNNANINFFNFFLKRLYAMIGKKVFPENFNLQRFYCKKGNEDLSEVFLIGK